MGGKMRRIVSIALVLASVFPAFCEFEILFDRYVSVEISPGEHADFEFYVHEPNRSVDTIYIELHKDIPDGWSATACTPWECFFEHATYVLFGPDSAQFSAHFITADSVPGEGSMSMVFTNVHTGFTDSVVFEVSTLAKITERTPERMKFSAYPNPFNSSVYINCRDGSRTAPTSYDIVNLEGKVVDTFTASLPFRWLPPSKLPSGIYIIYTISRIGSASTKVILLR